jgi:hypothetical protein
MIEHGFDISLAGPVLAIIGSLISIIGALINNCWHDHHGAMELWVFSNVMLLIWSVGYLGGLWDGGLSVGALMVMYLIFTVSNLYGLMK